MGAYKLNLGNANHYLKWDGFKLDIQGNIRIGGLGLDDEIYFKDSQLYLYDAYTLGYYKIAIRRNATDYFQFYHWTGGNSVLEARAGSITTLVAGANMGQLKNVYGDYSLTLNLIPGGGTALFNLYGTGQLKLPNLASDPTSNNAIGQICMVGGNLKRWDGESWVLV